MSLLKLYSLAAFYLISVLVGGFSSILAYGLMQMEGLSGIRGWQWIFVSERDVFEDIDELTVVRLSKG